MRSISNRTAGLTLFVSIAIVIAVQFAVWNHISDDAYISFRYAARLASGEGLTFNDNERVEGFSNPSWTLILAGIHRLTSLAIPDLARTAGLLGTFSILACMYLAGREDSTALIFSFAVLLLHPGFHIYATAGLEGPLFSLLLTVAFVATLRRTTRARTVAALALGLAGISRPEGILYGIFWLAFSLQLPSDILGFARREWKNITLVFLPALIWQVFRLLYFGSWVPNTAVAKLPGTFGGWLHILPYLEPAILMLGGPLVVIGLILARVTKENLPQRSSSIVALPFVLASFTFIVYARGDWMPFERFVVPVFPVVAIVFGRWMSTVLRHLQSSNTMKASRWLPHLAMVGIVLCSIFAWQSQVRAYADNKGVNMMMRGDDQIKVGEWLHKYLKPGSTVATGRLGGIGYAAPALTILDLNGLTDVEEAAFVARGRSPNAEDDPILQRNPDVIAAIDVAAEWGYKQDSSFVRWLMPKYEFVRSFSQGNFGIIDIWVSKARSSEVLTGK